MELGPQPKTKNFEILVSLQDRGHEFVFCFVDLEKMLDGRGRLYVLRQQCPGPHYVWPGVVKGGVQHRDGQVLPFTGGGSL